MNLLSKSPIVLALLMSLAAASSAQADTAATAPGGQLHRNRPVRLFRDLNCNRPVGKIDVNGSCGEIKNGAVPVGSFSFGSSCLGTYGRYKTTLDLETACKTLAAYGKVDSPEELISFYSDNFCDYPVSALAPGATCASLGSTDNPKLNKLMIGSMRRANIPSCDGAGDSLVVVCQGLTDDSQ